MTVLRIYLIAAFLTVAMYTAMVVGTHGWDLVSVFLQDLTAVNWAGQFNLDFLAYLWLSALWVAWRHEFTPAGIGLALLASVGGMLFLAVYLLFVSFRADGDLKVLVLGPGRAQA